MHTHSLFHCTCLVLLIYKILISSVSFRDIDKRILVSKFSAPSTSIYGCVPISLFQWQIKGSVCNYSSPEKLIEEVLDTTKMSFSGSSDNKLALPTHGEDVAIWILVSTNSVPDLQHSHESGDSQIDTVGCWRLALLVKDFVLMGNALDLRYFQNLILKIIWRA